MHCSAHFTMTKNRENTKKQQLEQEQEEEDWCFECKDGGQLVSCDYKNCGKVYHPECVGKDDSYFDTDKYWACGRHRCFFTECKKTSKFWCLGCPFAVCKKCVSTAEFTVVRDVQGLCGYCLRVVGIIEQNLDHDPEAEENKVTLNDTDTYECLFKEYWEMIKKREGLTDDEISAALPNYGKRKYDVLHLSYNEDNEVKEEKNDFNANKDNAVVPKFKKRKISKKQRKISKKRDFVRKPKCFASINVHNIKLIYLRKSLVLELSKERESFVSKVVGTFVRARVDFNDFTTKNSHHLLRVIGVEHDEVSNEILLEVSPMPKVISVSKISDIDFTKEECDDLRQKVDTGLLPKLTVEDLQEKATSLHEDITKHWIVKRLSELEVLIERANFKGRTKDKIAFLNEREELRQPWKQEQLLMRVPSVFPELMEAKYDNSDEESEETNR